MAKEVGNRYQEGLAYGHIAFIYARLGNLQEVLRYCNKHLSMAKEVGNREEQGKSYGNIGSTYNCLGKFQEALSITIRPFQLLKRWAIRFGKGLLFAISATIIPA